MHRFTRCVFFTALMVGGLSPRVPAQDTWTGASGPLWTTDGNWFLFAAPLPGADVAFDANTVGNFATVLGADYTLNSLTLADPPAAMSISSNLLTLGAGGVNMAAALQNLTINSRVVAATAQNWSVNAGALLQVAGRLEGPGALTKLGAGTVSFSANGTANVYSGDVVVAEGTLLLDGGANSYPFGVASNGVRTVTVLSNAVLTAANVTHNPLGAGTLGTLALVVSNGTFNVPAYCHVSNLTLWAGIIAPNGVLVEGLDLRAGARVMTRASDNPALISAKVTLRAQTLADVEDGAAAVDLSITGQIAANNQTLVKTNAGVLELAGTTDNVALALRNEQGKTVLAKASGPVVHAVGGGLVIYDGEVELAGSGGDQIFSNLNVVVNGGLFDLNGRAEGFGALAGTNGLVRNDDAALATLTVGENGNSGSYAGTILDGAGPIALIKVGTGTQMLTGTNTLSGGVAVNNGTLQVDGQLNGSAVAVAANATVLGSGQLGGAVTLAANARLVPGSNGLPRTLTISSNLVENAGTTNLFDLANPAVVGGGVNDLIAVLGDLNAGGALVQPRWLAAPQVGSYRLFNYAGSLTGTFILSTNTARLGMAIDTATPSEVNLAVTGAVGDLRWNGTTNGVWQYDVFPNWYDIPGLTPGLVFRDYDRVRFDDTVGVTNTVAVTGTVLPGAVIVENSTNTITLAGAGKISGLTGITKLGTSVVTVSSSGGNDFTGPVVVSQGVFRVGVNAALGKSSGVTVGSGAKLDLNGVSQAGQSYAYSIAGAGPDGSGALFNAAANIGANSGITGLTLAADAAIGLWCPTNSDAARVDIGLGGWQNGGGFTLTKIGGGPLGLRGAASNFLAVVVSNGFLFSETVDNSWGTNLIVESAARIGMYNNRRTTAAILMRGGAISTWGSVGSTFAGPITLASNSTLDTESRVAAYGGSEIFVAGSIGGPGRLTKLGTQTAHLLASNSFTSGLVINNGGGQVNVNSSNGPAIASNVQLGHDVEAGSSSIRCYQNNQFGPGVVVTNRNSWGDWGHLLLLGTTQTIAGIDDLIGSCVLGSADQDAGVARPSVLVIDAATDHQFNGFLWDRNTTNSTTAFRIVKTGPGTQGLSGSVKWGLVPLSGGLVVSNGFVNLQNHRSLGASAIELAGGGLQLDAPGLLEGNQGNVWLATSNAAWAVKRTPHFANLDYGDLNAWDNTCWMYTGYLRVTNATPVTWSFGENYDDRAYLKIDDTVLLNNQTWNQPTVGTITLTPGLHRFELQVFDGSGGGGPNGGFTVGVGIDYAGLNQTNAGNFVRMEDDGTGNLFLTQVTLSNAIQLRAHAQLKSSFPYGPTSIVSSAITEAGGAFGLTKVGAGALALTAPSFGFTGPLTVQGGLLIVERDLGSAMTVTVENAATIFGAGSRGATTVEHGGTLEIRSAGGGETNYVAPAVTLGDSAAATTRVSVVIGGVTNILVATDAGGLTANGTVLIDVTAAGALYGGTTDLIRYSGTLNGSISNFQLGVIPTNLIGTATLQDSGSAIQLVLTAGSSLFWVGAPNSWDVGGNANWAPIPGGTPTTFATGNGVTFDDTAANFTVDIGAGVEPGTMLVDASANDYTFIGATRSPARRAWPSAARAC
jgi:fibronectin-binding autotransporter adhesin